MQNLQEPAVVDASNANSATIGAPVTAGEVPLHSRSSLVVARGLVRRPICVKRIQRQLREIAMIRGLPLKKIRVLEVCCGVAVYATVLCPFYNVSVVEPDIEIVRHLQMTFLGTRVNTICSDANSMPFDTRSFDMVILHLEDEFNLLSIRRILAEQFRVLKDGGAICIFNTEPDQLADGFWYSAFLQDALVKAREHHTPNDDMYTLLNEAGFRNTYVHCPKNTLIQSDFYNDAEAFFSEWYRAGDPICRWATEHEIQTAITEIKSMKAASQFDDFIERHNKFKSPQVSLFISFIPFQIF